MTPPHQQTTSTAAHGKHPPGVGITGSNQPRVTSIKIMEAVELVLAPPLFIPVAPQLLATPDKGDGIHEAAIQQAQTTAGKIRPSLKP